MSSTNGNFLLLIKFDRFESITCKTGTAYFYIKDVFAIVHTYVTLYKRFYAWWGWLIGPLQALPHMQVFGAK